MPQAKLILNNGNEVSLESEVTSIGRVPENTISFSEDSSISRYHIEIEKRAGGKFWLIELGSSNGTTVNGVKVYSERLLKDGDVIVLGGSNQIVFRLENDAETASESIEEETSSSEAPSASGVQSPSELPNVETAPETPVAAAADTAKSSKVPMLLGIAAVVCGLAVVCVVAAVAISFSGGFSKCEVKAKIVSPETGDLISKETDVEVEAENADCAKRAIFLLDGVEFASATESPYKTSLNPKDFPGLSDGLNHSLKVAFEDSEGNKTVQPDEVLLSFETLATPTPTPEVTPEPEAAPTPKKSDEKPAPPKDTLAMVQQLLKQFSASPAYQFDPQFVQEVQKKTSEYKSEGYYTRAEPFRDLINIEFHKENNLDAPLGFLLAMSRSGFKPQKQGSEEGLWRLTDAFVTGNNYKASCLADSLSDPTQKCAAKTASVYLKSLYTKIFNSDLVYTVAAFGMSEQDASGLQSSLPANRADFWKVLKSPQRDQVVNFFAAGIVADNPQKFGLKDRPISDLYKNMIGN